ncbi:MAG: PEGA domain-containing protein [Sedimentisphaerales bacterium]|nr:PEGA domain-containing protein [Sedimentisphaerales bacterium]
MNKLHCLTFLILLISLPGCVERLITIDSSPSGALVWLNDQEIGQTPVTVPFTWYGKYEVILRKDGYRSLKTAQDADAPIYQWPGIDLIFESILPFEFVDHHRWQYDLEPITDEDPQLLIERAQQLREQTQNLPRQ